jgi:hypothetical protein
MSLVEITEEQDRYNQVAIKYADKIQQARSATKPTSPPAVDDCFPSFNRAVQHYAASDYYPHDRLLRRVTVSGDRPYYNPVS